MPNPAESLDHGQERPSTSRPALRVVQGRRTAVPPTRTRPQSHPAGPELQVCVILDGPHDQDGGQVWRVSPTDASAELTARRADGCLLEPTSGDVVLVMRHSGAVHYVLNILEKKETARALRFPGDLELDVSQGRCALHARSLDLTGREKAMVCGEEVTLAGKEGRLRFARLDVLAKTLEARMQSVHALGQTVRFAAAHLTSRLGRALRLTGFELHRAETIRTEVEERFTVQAGQADILAREDVTVDGEKIHLG
ncbi:DUF3540 domain-containing protein [Desulfonatronum sp. SC1]|uniref:DUF3540 domain-containing protein n=1 Tax=Desulfonatronum sp. SC1 TaxID=2109626 RepID=UPI000D30CC50|nr:DUF3540 domain-containing protein [Desulfonatronum sp. SC1]PTN36740.1 hypothetical protein C6366_08820 [Desulfonatronum sp. SC1]